MGNDPNWKRTTPEERNRPPRYLHVSVLVGKEEVEIAPGIKAIVPTRTPKGKGGTARKHLDVEKIIRVGRHRRELQRAARSASGVP